jgi:hypothetical protein
MYSKLKLAFVLVLPFFEIPNDMSSIFTWVKRNRKIPEVDLKVGRTE